MRYDELSNFTYEELSYFTYADLALGKLELLEKANSDIGVPDEIIDKIYALCDEAMKQFQDLSIELPADQNSITLHKVIEILKVLKPYAEITKQIFEFVLKFYNLQ